jgi:hypothetical protein
MGKTRNFDIRVVCRARTGALMCQWILMNKDFHLAATCTECSVELLEPRCWLKRKKPINPLAFPFSSHDSSGISVARDDGRTRALGMFAWTVTKTLSLPFGLEFRPGSTAE